MKFVRYSLAPIALLLMAAAPNGQSIAQNGNNNGAMSCASCHGPTFGGNPGLQAPALAGLPAAQVLFEEEALEGQVGCAPPDTLAPFGPA